MKNLKKDIPSILGLITTASLAVISGGIITPATKNILTVGGNIGASLAANFLTGFTPAKIKKWFVDVHPDKLNHSIKKLFVASTVDALSNISILFSEAQATNDKKTQARKLIKILQKQLPNMLMNGTQIRLEESEIKHFLYKKNKEEEISRFIEDQFNTFGIDEPFKSFLAENLPAQIQLCFGEGLKDTVNHDAWVAFQRMLIEETRNDIKQIAETQQRLIDGVSVPNPEEMVFSEEQIAKIYELVEILNNKELIEIKISDSINQSLVSIEAKANEIIRITTKTQISVDELKAIIEKVKRQNRNNHIIICTLVVCLLGVGIFGIYKLINCPFKITIQIVDWNNRTNNSEIYNNGGTLFFDSKQEYDKILTNANNGRFSFNLPASYNKKSVRVYFLPQQKKYQFMKLDTTIVIHRDSTYHLRMTFDGIDKITRKVIDNSTLQSIEGAIVQIKGAIDITDKDGKFTIRLPLEEQQLVQKLTIKKEGYIDYINSALDMTTSNENIGMESFKK